MAKKSTKYDLVAIAMEEEILGRCSEISDEFHYTYTGLRSVDEFAEREQEFSDVTFILLSAESVKKEADIAGMVQVVRQFATEAYIMVSIDSKMNPSTAVFVKKSGANVVLLADEVRNTSKLEFIASQKIRASYLPIKVKDLTPETQIDFPLYYLMPLNRKFLPILKAGTLSTEKIEKMSQVGEIYIRREDADRFKKYINAHEDNSAKGLVRRCRAQFLSLLSSYVELVLMISDQSESASFSQGMAIYDQCEKLSSELMLTLGAVGDGWEVVNNSAIGEFGSVERAPATAAYAGLLSLQCGIGDQTPIMTAALICDLSIMDLPPRATKKIRKGAAICELHPEDQEIYKQHPTASLNKALSRKLQIPEPVKNIILCTHEQMDQKGFPNALRTDKIPAEALIIQICEMMDKRSLIRMGEVRPDINVVKQQLLTENLAAPERFGMLFLEKIKSCLKTAA